MKIVAILTIVLTLTLSLLLIQEGSVAKTTTKKNRDQELFLEGAKALSKRSFAQGRILLNTMIYTYPDSPLVEQAKLLVFYSYGREGGPKNEKAAELLKEIEEQMKAYEIKHQIQ